MINKLEALSPFYDLRSHFELKLAPKGAYNKFVTWIFQLLLPDKSISHPLLTKTEYCTSLPILTENLMVEEVPDKSSDKHVCSLFVFEPKTAVRSVWDIF